MNDEHHFRTICVALWSRSLWKYYLPFIIAGSIKMMTDFGEWVNGFESIYPSRSEEVEIS